MAEGLCYHCGEPMPAGVDLSAHIAGVARPVCCRGCQAVARLIANSGLGDFYRFRNVDSAKADGVACARADWLWLDRPAIARHYGIDRGANARQITLTLDNVQCAACAWLIQHYLNQQSGVEQASVDLQAARLHLLYKPAEVALSELATALTALGYRPHLDGTDTRLAAQKRERRSLLLRLAVAGIGMMQVMSYAAAVYIGALQDLDEQTRQFFHSVSMLVALPIALFSGWPFYLSAWRSLRHRRLGMDVPVAIAIVLALSISVVNTLRATGDIYFDSVTMFVFFLLLGRYSMTCARQGAQDSQSALAASLPEQITRLDEHNQEQRLARIELEVGHRVRVVAGEALPGDGVIEQGEAMLDEALLSGESMPCRRQAGDRALAGSINRDGSLVVRIDAVGSDTLLGQIRTNLEQAATRRPRRQRLADRLARHFVAFVLTGAASTALYWWVVDPERALSVVIAVLVVSCPCALALGTPTALAAGTRRLARNGILVPDPERLELGGRLTDVVLDKTGTLTSDRMRVTRVLPAAGLTREQVLDLAASLERHSQHPIARAIVAASPASRAAAQACDTDLAQVIAGQGVLVQRDRRELIIGKPEFVARFLGLAELTPPFPEMQIAMAERHRGVLGWIALDSPLREGMDVLLNSLRRRGLRLHLASGDRQSHVDALASGRPLDSATGDMTPEAKLELLQGLRNQGRRLAVIGDGINDAPMLAAADLAIALADGAALARTRADLILSGNSLQPLVTAMASLDTISQRVRQNLLWALGYNLLALPLAAAGMVPAWAAAIGMSLSSLLVVVNARRPERQAAQRNSRMVEVEEQ